MSAADELLDGYADAPFWSTGWDSSMRRLAPMLRDVVVTARVYERETQLAKGATFTAQQVEILDAAQDGLRGALERLDAAAAQELNSGRL